MRAIAYFTGLPQYSQQPEASGKVLAPQQGHITACLGAFAAAMLSRTVWRTLVSAYTISWPSFSYERYSMLVRGSTALEEKPGPPWLCSSMELSLRRNFISLK